MYCVKVCGTGGRRINGGDEMIGEYVIIWHMLKARHVAFFNNLLHNRLVRGESTEDSEEVVPGERDDERERWRRRRLRLSLRLEDCLGGVVADDLGWVSWLADDLDWVSMTECVAALFFSTANLACWAAAKLLTEVVAAWAAWAAAQAAVVASMIRFSKLLNCSWNMSLVTVGVGLSLVTAGVFRRGGGFLRLRRTAVVFRRGVDLDFFVQARRCWVLFFDFVFWVVVECEGGVGRSCQNWRLFPCCLSSLQNLAFAAITSAFRTCLSGLKYDRLYRTLATILYVVHSASSCSSCSRQRRTKSGFCG